jgi:hypothetical protein
MLNDWISQTDGKVENGPETFIKKLSRRIVHSRVVEAMENLEQIHKSSSSSYQSLQAEIRSLGDTQLEVLVVMMSWMISIAMHGEIMKDASVVAPGGWTHLLSLADSDILMC